MKMNLHEEEWILMIADERNITRAAEKLYVSPSALTQTVNRIEHDLGTKLFIRSRKGCALTNAGEIYVEGIRKMLQVRRETCARIRDAAEIKNTELSIGFPPEHGGHMFTSIYPVIRESFPGIRITIHETSVRKQQAMIASGELDLGFLKVIDSQKTEDEYVPIAKEELLIALPTDSEPTKWSRMDKDSRFPILDIAHLRGFPMAQLYRESTFFSWTSSVFEEAGIAPCVTVETTRHSTLLHMVGTGLCGGLVTDYHCRAVQPDEKISFFCLPTHPYWRFMVSYRRGGYLSKPMKMFISLAQDYYQRNSLQTDRTSGTKYVEREL